MAEATDFLLANLNLSSAVTFYVTYEDGIANLLANGLLVLLTNSTFRVSSLFCLSQCGVPLSD